MTWFAIVLMVQTAGITPIWVLSGQTFESQDTCTEFINTNQDSLFYSAIEAHDFKIKPTVITCIPTEAMENLLKESMRDEDDPKTMGKSL